MFVTNNNALFHLLLKGNFAKHQKVSKYYGQDCSICSNKVIISYRNYTSKFVVHTTFSYLISVAGSNPAQDNFL